MTMLNTTVLNHPRIGEFALITQQHRANSCVIDHVLLSISLWWCRISDPALLTSPARSAPSDAPSSKTSGKRVRSLAPTAAL